MAGETILVVDDEPVSLRLAAAVLRGDGFKVHLASSGEQALSTLNTMLPDLMLVDMQLPGMHGLELTRHVRAQPRTKNLLVVALTASTSREHESSAYEAGCDGFIPKPIDTRALGQRLRAIIDGQMESPVPVESEGAIPAGLSFTGPELESMRRSFLADGNRQVRRMMAFVTTQIDAGGAARIFHQWIGAAGALGYMEIAEKARAAETLLERPGWTKGEFKDALTTLVYAFQSPKEASSTPIPDSIVQELNRKRVGLVGFADDEADKICAAFEGARALPLLFGIDERMDSDAIRGCSVVMVHVREETLNSAWLQPEGNLPPAVPLVLVGGREHLLELDAAVQSRACEYLIDGWQPEEVVMRLSFAISRAGASKIAAAEASNSAPQAGPVRRALGSKAQILIADDDTHVLAVVRSALQNLGIECRAASSGPEALSLIREMSPHAAVLDVNMPGMDGFEILSTVRQEGLPTRILMLTARQHESDVLRGFTLGADDYVVKPFNPLELAARLKRLL
jgi:DNA-binding response OmpR family regulator